MRPVRVVPRAIRLAACLVLAPLAACGGPVGSASEVAVTRVDSAGVAVVAISGDPADLPEVTLSEAPFAVVSGDAEPYLSAVGEVAFRSDGSLLVEDDGSAQLHLFDADGRWLGLVSGTGDGPGEMRNLSAISVRAGDTLHAYDRRLARVSTFDSPSTTDTCC